MEDPAMSPHLVLWLLGVGLVLGVGMLVGRFIHHYAARKSL